jgi:hypothetical protein
MRQKIYWGFVCLALTLTVRTALFSLSASSRHHLIIPGRQLNSTEAGFGFRLLAKDGENVRLVPEADITHIDFELCIG